MLHFRSFYQISFVIAALVVPDTWCISSAEAAAPVQCQTYGFSYDGNEHDRDDIGAMPVAITIIDSGELWSNAVHIDYNSHYLSADDTNALPNAEQADDMRASFTGTWKAAAGTTFDLTKDTAGAVANLAVHLQDSGFCYIVGGPWEIANRGIDAVLAQGATVQATFITHSNWNDAHADANARNRADAESAANINVIGIGNQNDTDFNTSSADDWHWMADEYGYDYIPEALARERKKGDVSDAGMVFFAITGNEQASMADIKAFFADNGTSSSAAPVTTETTESAPVVAMSEADVSEGTQPASGATDVNSCTCPKKNAM